MLVSSRDSCQNMAMKIKGLRCEECFPQHHLTCVDLRFSPDKLASMSLGTSWSSSTNKTLQTTDDFLPKHKHRLITFKVGYMNIIIGRFKSSKLLKKTKLQHCCSNKKIQMNAYPIQISKAGYIDPQ